MNVASMATPKNAPPIIRGSLMFNDAGFMIVMMIKPVAAADRAAPNQSYGGRLSPTHEPILRSSKTTNPQMKATAVGIAMMMKRDCHGRNCKVMPATMGPIAPPSATAVV